MLMISQNVWAGAIISYNGRIMKPDGKPLEESSVAFTVSIYSSEPEKCLLYQEKQIIDMTGSGGLFAISVGSGKGVKTAADPGIDVDLLFSNNTDYTFTKVIYPKLTCEVGNSYQPQLLDQRMVAVSFNDGKGSGEQTLPASEISFVPMALNANNAQKLNGYAADKFLRVDTNTALDPLTVTEYNSLKTNAALTTRVTAVENSLNEKASLNGALFNAAISAPAYLYTSDQRLKKNIQTYPDGLNAILDMRGVTFDWKKDDQSEVGLIAQEVEKVDSRLVVETKKEDGSSFKSVKYGNIVAILIEAVKELFVRSEQRNVEVDKELQALKIEIQNLRKELKDLSTVQSCKQSP